MMALHDWLVYLHIAAGAIALVLFWIPAIARKGSPLHVRAGRWYTHVMYVVCATAFVASLMVLLDPLGVRRPGESFDAGQASELAATYRIGALFLLMLAVLVFTSIRHGIAALRARTVPGAMRALPQRLMIASLAILAVVVGAIGISNHLVLLMIFSVISLSGAYRMFRDSRVEKPTRRERTLAHLNGLIGSGIGAYTAFFAFGGARFLANVLEGQWQALPWVLPAIIGTAVIAVLKRRYGAPGVSRSGA